MTASKKGISKFLWDIFYDEIHKEYTKTSYSRNFLLMEIQNTFPDVDWRKDIYPIISRWQKRVNEYYDGIYNEHKILLEAGVMDTCDICVRKYETFLTLFITEKKVPLYYDKDTKEYRVAIDLTIYEEIIGDKVIKYHRLRNKSLSNLAKRGGKLSSGIDSRQVIYDMFDENQLLEDRLNKKQKNK